VLGGRQASACKRTSYIPNAVRGLMMPDAAMATSTSPGAHPPSPTSLAAQDAVVFFEKSGLPRETLAKVGCCCCCCTLGKQGCRRTRG